MDEPRFETLAVRAGQEPDELTGAVAPPIYQTSTYAQEGVGRPTRGYEYARTQNPTRERLERAVATLEGGRHGIAFASGSAATAAIVELVAPGEVVSPATTCTAGPGASSSGSPGRAASRRTGSTSRRIRPPRCGPVSTSGPGSSGSRPRRTRTSRSSTSRPSPSGWTRTGARTERPLLVVDNTFASPAVQRPLALGADISFHSATKYLAGHSDTVSGIAVTNRDDLAERLRFLQNALGAVPGPFDCFLVLRGLRTLALRVERHSSNAAAVARFLAARDDVEWVRYPGLADGPSAHPQAALAARQMRHGGGMVSFAPRAGGRHARDARPGRSRSARPPGSSPWPNRSVGSSR